MSYSSILEAIKSASEITPDKNMLRRQKNKVTYKQFWKMINKGASFLEENGVKRETLLFLKGAQKVGIFLQCFQFSF